MNAAVCKGLKKQSWKDLFQAAIYESDLNKLPERISEAEAALIARGREPLYAAGDDGDEGESLDDAMCILHALRRSLKRRPTTVPSANRVDRLTLSAG
jgi:hypothetical protein